MMLIFLGPFVLSGPVVVASISVGPQVEDLEQKLLVAKNLSKETIVAPHVMSSAKPWSGPGVLRAGPFSKDPVKKGLPEKGKRLRFTGVKPTKYSLIQDGSEWVVKAESRFSASGFITRLEVDPNKYPIMKWRWKVENLPEKSNLTTKSGDDHPARVYVGFE